MIIVGIATTTISIILMIITIMVYRKEESLFETPKELSPKQKEEIDGLVNEYIGDKTKEITKDMQADIEKMQVLSDETKEAFDKLQNRLAEITAEADEATKKKIQGINDYSVTIKEEIERNHNEVMFLYSVLSDKQNEIVTTATMVDEYIRSIDEYIQANLGVGAVENALQYQQEANINANEINNSQVASEENRSEAFVQPKSEPMTESAIEPKQEQKVEAKAEPEEVAEPEDPNKEIIIEMHKSGLSIIEIAKHLGLGVGEIKLVVDLYREQGGNQ